MATLRSCSMSGEDDGARLPSRTTSLRRLSPTSGLLVMGRHSRRFPGAAQIFENDLDAFDIESDGTAAGEDELDRSLWRSGSGNKGDGEQRQHRVWCALADPVRLDAFDTGELKPRRPALGLRILAGANRPFPIEAIDQQNEFFQPL